MLLSADSGGGVHVQGRDGVLPELRRTCDGDRSWTTLQTTPPVQQPFQIFGVDIMELPMTEKGNRYVFVFQDFLTKWLLVFPAPDQKAIRITRLVAERGFPLVWCSRCSTLRPGSQSVGACDAERVGIRKLNTTAYHPQCDGMVECLNRTLKTMLRKQVTKFHGQGSIPTRSLMGIP